MSKINEARNLAEKKIARHQTTGNQGALRNWMSIKRALAGESGAMTQARAQAKLDQARGCPWEKNWELVVAGLEELAEGRTDEARRVRRAHAERVERERKSAEIIAEQKRLEGKNMDDLAAEQRAEEERMRAQWDAEDRARREADAERILAIKRDHDNEVARQLREKNAEAAKWEKYTLRGIPIPGPARDAKRRQSQGDEFFQTTGYMFFWCLERLNTLSIKDYNACLAWCKRRKAGRGMAECLDLNPSTVYTWLAIYLDEELDMIGGSTADFRKYHKEEVDEIKALRVST